MAIVVNKGTWSYSVLYEMYCSPFENQGFCLKLPEWGQGLFSLNNGYVTPKNWTSTLFGVLYLQSITDCRLTSELGLTLPDNCKRLLIMSVPKN